MTLIKNTAAQMSVLVSMQTTVCPLSVQTAAESRRLLQQAISGSERKVLSATSTGTIVAHMRAACSGCQFPGKKVNTFIRQIIH